MTFFSIEQMQREDVVHTLSEYHKISARIAMGKERINAYKQAIDNPHLVEEFTYSVNAKELGMPISPSWKPGSPTERVVEEMQLTVDAIIGFIREVEREIKPYERRKDKIDIALKHLLPWEQTIITARYMHGLKWSEVTDEYNKHHRTADSSVQEERVKKIHGEIIEKIVEMMAYGC